MEKLAPTGPVYQAGTLSGNPVAMAAGIATLKILKESKGSYEKLERMTAGLCKKMQELFDKKNLPVKTNRIGSMFTIFFTADEVYDYQSAARSDTRLFASYFRGMLSQGINLAPSQFEAAFLCFAHTDEDLEKTIAACGKTIKTL